MKCIQCGVESLSHSVGEYASCKSCGHPWAFIPDKMSRIKFTDSFFWEVLSEVSANNRLFFTPKQLAYSLDKKLKEKSHNTGFGWIFFYIFITIWASGFWGIFLSLAFGNSSIIVVFFVVSFLFMSYFFYASQSPKVSEKVREANARNLRLIGLLVLGIGVVANYYLFNSSVILAVTIVLSLLSISVGVWQKLRQGKLGERFLFRSGLFDAWLMRWTQVNGAIANLLPAPSEETDEVNLDPNADYWNRVLVCDNDAIAQMLIANHFEEENRCVVISIQGYPQSRLDCLQSMINRNSPLKVYALHDASLSGVSLVPQLRESEAWFQGKNVSIYDLGLRPRQVWKNENSVIHFSKNSASQVADLLPTIQEELPANELAWLQLGFFVELESFPPEKLLQVVAQKIANSDISSEGDDHSIGNIDPTLEQREGMSVSPV